MRVQLAEMVSFARVSQRKRDLTVEQNDKLRPIVSDLLDSERKEREAERARDGARDLGERKGPQETLALKLGLSQSALSGFLAGRQGTSVAVALRACVLAGTPPADVLGEDFSMLSPHGLPPKDAAKFSPVWPLANKATREAYERLAPYTRTPDGARVDRNVVWFTMRLASMVEMQDGEDGGMFEPPGAERIDTPSEPPPTPLRRVRPKRSRG